MRNMEIRGEVQATLKWCVVVIIYLGFVCLVIFYGLYHGKSPLNYHLKLGYLHSKSKLYTSNYSVLSTFVY